MILSKKINHNYYNMLIFKSFTLIYEVITIDIRNFV